ncbi:biotin transporter BioY [Leuconostoc gelidum]|uniref:biotin transporter BioY n=1 Tax=Leuconostoc gelidum TaxID=1244 RepID=UPI00202B7C2F|nr:biotin transporter BioY [Leuconostoc gelidum]
MTNILASVVNLTIGTIWLTISMQLPVEAGIAAGITPFILSSALKITVVVIVALAVRQVQARTALAF